MSLNRQLRYFQMQYDRAPGRSFWIPLADLFVRSEQSAEALPLLRRGLTDQPQSVSGQWVLAKCLRSLGENEEALATAHTVLEADAGHREAPSWIAELEQELEADSVAVEATAEDTADDTVEEEPPSPEVHEDSSSEPDPVVPEPVIVAPAEPVLSVVTDPSPPVEPEAEPPVVEEKIVIAVDDHQSDQDPREELDQNSTFVTRTLADIYLAQGHQDKALQILYQVLANHPEREDIIARIATIENSASAPEPTTKSTASKIPHPNREEENKGRFEAWLQKEAGGSE